MTDSCKHIDPPDHDCRWCGARARTTWPEPTEANYLAAYLFTYGELPTGLTEDEWSAWCTQRRAEWLAFMDRVPSPLSEVIAMVLAPPEPIEGAVCREPGCVAEVCLACPVCGWHRPHCCCV